jgi:ribosome maturation factor RimP
LAGSKGGDPLGRREKAAGRPLFLFVGAEVMYRDIPEELRELVEPVVVDAGLELVDALLTRGPRPWLLRITVDTPDGDGRVAVERCAEVSREIGTHLDAADVVPGAYKLEVSSPGLDRLLAREKDFSAACGSRVQVETRRPLEGRRRFRGLLVAFDQGLARVAVDGGEIPIPFDEVSKAKILYEFTRADFAPAAESR